MNSDTQRMLLIAYMVTLLFFLALSLAIGKVEEKTSFGLQPVLTCFEVLVGAGAGYAFGKKTDEEATRKLIQQMMDEFEKKQRELEERKKQADTNVEAAA